MKWKWKSLSPVRLFAASWTIQPMEFSSPEYSSGRPFPSSGDLLNPEIEPRSPALQVDSLPAEPQGKPKNIGVGSLSLLQQIFPTKESNRGLLYCRRILYQLIHQGSLLIGHVNIKCPILCQLKLFSYQCNKQLPYRLLWRLNEISTKIPQTWCNIE